MATARKVKAPLKPLTRAEERAIRLRELRAKAKAEGTAAQAFPTATPVYADEAGLPDATPPVVEEGRLASLAHEINERFVRAERAETQANDHRLAAALRLAEAQKICDEVKIPFRKWAEAHIPHPWNNVRLLTNVGKADDPRAALEDLRNKNNAANRAMRERKALGRERLRAPKKGTLAATIAAAEPEERSYDLTAITDGIAQEGTIATDIGLMGADELREVADKAASRLPAEEARHHVETLASKLGLEVVRDTSNNFFVSVDSLLADFSRLEYPAQAEFLARAAEVVGALIEMPA